MDLNLFPTKGNLILIKNSLRLAEQGYDLLDKKRNILIREMMDLIDRAKFVQDKINDAYTEAYKALQTANVFLGVNNVSDISNCVDIDDSIKIRTRSVMGVEIPEITHEPTKIHSQYDVFNTTYQLDEAFIKFTEVKDLTIELAGIESAVCRLAVNIKKTQKRANSLKSIMIPRYQKIVKEMTDFLEEKEREEFTRLKVIKHHNEANKNNA